MLITSLSHKFFEIRPILHSLLFSRAGLPFLSLDEPGNLPVIITTLAGTQTGLVVYARVKRIPFSAI